MKNIRYFDHAATTGVKEEVLKEMLPYFNIEYGNPSSIYGIGRSVKRAIEGAREKVAKAIKHIVLRDDTSAIIIDHDIVFIDYISDRAMVFYGEPSSKGHATAPINLRDAMNKFLSDVEITFRRDKETNRPRVNKTDSYLDREQKEKGEYYYLEE